MKEKPSKQEVCLLMEKKEIASKRKKFNALRRKLTRTRAIMGANEEPAHAEENYKNSKMKLKKAIIISKNKKWEILCDELETDIWGKTYKIATKKFSR